MILLIDWVTKIITVPRAELTLISGTLYELDTIAFKVAIRDLEASIEGIIHPSILSYNQPYTVTGITYAAKVEMLNGYKVQFEVGVYSVLLKNSNNNIFDISSSILIQNTVQVIPSNSAGNQIITTGSGVTSGDVTAIANKVNDVLLDDFSAIDTKVTDVHKFLGLDPNKPMTIATNGQTTSDMTVTITDNGNGTVTLLRTV